MCKSKIIIGMLILGSLFLSAYAQSSLGRRNSSARNDNSESQALYLKIETKKAPSFLAKKAPELIESTKLFDCTCVCGACERRCYVTCNGCALPNECDNCGTSCCQGVPPGDYDLPCIVQ